MGKPKAVKPTGSKTVASNKQVTRQQDNSTSNTNTVQNVAGNTSTVENINDVTNSISTVAPNAGGLNILNQISPTALRLANGGGGLSFGEAEAALRALEEFSGKDFRNSSDVNPLLLEAAQGKFLTQESGNPFLEDLIKQQQRLTSEAFNEQVLPGIAAQFSGAGGFNSSTRAAVTAANARDLQRSLGDIATTTGFNVFEAERGRQVQAQEILAQIEAANSDRTLSALGARADTAVNLGNLRIGAQNSQISAINAAAGLVPLFGTTTTGNVTRNVTSTSNTTSNQTTTTNSNTVNSGTSKQVVTNRAKEKTTPIKASSSKKKKPTGGAKVTPKQTFFPGGTRQSDGGTPP